MKYTLLLLVVLFALVVSVRAEDARAEKLRAVDDERVAAVLAGDRARLTTIFSDELRYAHSSGTVDDKAGYIESLVTRRSKYNMWKYEERNFTFPAPGIALMTGRIAINVTNDKGTSDMVLGFLGVWREEKGTWRFLAWQSCKMPVAPVP